MHKRKYAGCKYTQSGHFWCERHHVNRCLMSHLPCILFHAPSLSHRRHWHGPNRPICVLHSHKMLADRIERDVNAIVTRTWWWVCRSYLGHGIFIGRIEEVLATAYRYVHRIELWNVHLRHCEQCTKLRTTAVEAIIHFNAINFTYSRAMDKSFLHNRLTYRM